MTGSIVPRDRGRRGAASYPLLDRWAKRALFSRLAGIREGRLTMRDVEREQAFGCATGDDPLEATVTVREPSFYRRVVLGGGVGAGESYIEGAWSCDDLASLIRIMVRNRDVMEALGSGAARLSLPFLRLYHGLRRNTRAGSRRNIEAHYDLGNEFYALWLDETMTYSCGIFERPDSTLGDASRAKYDRICRKLEISSADHVVEIGTGWGGFALHAAGRYGCRVTTTTLSRRQQEHARRRLAEAGVADRVEVCLSDYRDLRGQYDKLVSIEMIEAVGHQHLGKFFSCCGRLLKPEGRMALQAITIEDAAFDRHKRRVDFIKRYVFPGSCIPSVTALCRAATGASDLRLVHLEDITPHYARTLSEWRSRFFARIDDVRRLGFSESFIRLWEYYLCYCEGGFAERYLGSAQMIFARPLFRPGPILPPLGHSGEGA